MALQISDRCINCGYCIEECPNRAIYEPGMKWTLKEGTKLMGTVILNNGKQVEAGQMMEPLSEEFYFIVPEKCAECKGLHGIPQCLEVCPDPDAIVVHPSYRESADDLLDKQLWLNL